LSEQPFPQTVFWIACGTAHAARVVQGPAQDQCKTCCR